MVWSEAWASWCVNTGSVQSVKNVTSAIAAILGAKLVIWRPMRSTRTYGHGLPGWPLEALLEDAHYGELRSVPRWGKAAEKTVLRSPEGGGTLATCGDLRDVNFAHPPEEFQIWGLERLEPGASGAW